MGVRNGVYVCIAAWQVPARTSAKLSLMNDSAPLLMPAALVGQGEAFDLYAPSLWRAEYAFGNVVDVKTWTAGRDVMIVLLIGGNRGEETAAENFRVVAARQLADEYVIELCVPWGMFLGSADPDLTWLQIGIDALKLLRSKFALPAIPLLVLQP